MNNAFSCFTLQTLLMQSFDEESSSLVQLSLETMQPTESIPAEPSVQEIHKGVLRKTSTHQGTSHAYAANVEDYTSMMSMLKVFQRMPETNNYLRQQPTAVQQ